MRASPYAEGALCRCGFTVDHEDLVATRARFVGTDERATALRHAGRFIPIPQAEPGIRVGSFADLNKVSWWRRPEKMTPEYPDSIDAEARRIAKSYGLEVQEQEVFGTHLVLSRPGGQRENLERHFMYGMAPLDQIGECIASMFLAIVTKHGPGKLWGLSGIVHPISDDDPGAAEVSDVGGVPHVWLRSAYFHDPVLAAVRAPTMDEQDCLSKLTGDRVDWVCDTCKGFGFGMHRCKGPDPVAGETSVATPAGPLTFKRTVVSRDGAMQSIQLKASERSPLAFTTGPTNQVWPRSFRTLPDGRVETEWADVEVARESVMYDGTPLGILLDKDRERRQEIGRAMRTPFTTLQRDAISAWNSDRLRAKLKASAAADKARETSVVVDLEDL